MYFQDFITAFFIRQIDRNLTIKTTGAKQCGIQHIRTVGSRNNDNTVVLAHAVHFYQQLIECLFTLIIAAAHSSTALSSDCVNLVDEYDTRFCLLRFFEHIAHTTGPGTDKHLHEIRSGYGEKRHIRFSGNGFR